MTIVVKEKKCTFVLLITRKKIMNAMADNNRKLDKETSDKVSFIAFIVPEFAAAFKMKISDAYKYLKKYGGLEFLHKHWWALHTDNEYYTLLDLYEVCLKNGGQR